MMADSRHMTSTTHRHTAAVLGVLVLIGAACGDDEAASPARTETSSSAPAPTETAALAEGTSVADPVIDPGDGGDYRAQLDAAETVDVVDNPYFPLPVGARWVYEGASDGEAERIEVEVLDETRRIMGIEAVVVRDRASINGELAEDTLDFFTQDRDGNVWYLGEETAEYEDGEVTTTAGSFLAGVDGAQPGLIMLAEPAVGDAYRQEFYVGEAEDMGEVVALGGTGTTPFGSFEDVLTTRDWTPLEPEVTEEKQYAPGVGAISAETVDGGDAKIELVEFTRP